MSHAAPPRRLRAARRERQLAAFADTAATIARESTLEVVLDRLAAEVRTATGMATCAVLLMDGPGEEVRYVLDDRASGRERIAGKLHLAVPRRRPIREDQRAVARCAVLSFASGSAGGRGGAEAVGSVGPLR